MENMMGFLIYGWDPIFSKSLFIQFPLSQGKKLPLTVRETPDL